MFQTHVYVSVCRTRIYNSRTKFSVKKISLTWEKEDNGLDTNNEDTLCLQAFTNKNSLSIDRVFWQSGRKKWGRIFFWFWRLTGSVKTKFFKGFVWKGLVFPSYVKKWTDNLRRVFVFQLLELCSSFFNILRQYKVKKNQRT